MMLYVFYVDTGTMLTFDMSFALETVHQLRQLIEKTYNIPYKIQVLLVSGGEALDEKTKVCSYSAGTDTNPIFLFTMSEEKPTMASSTNSDPGKEKEFVAKIMEATMLPATYETVVHRVQLAQKLDESAKYVTRICEELVHEQHLQQQGWSAVIANLDDIITDFKKRPETAGKIFNEYLSERDNYLKSLNYFNDDLQILDKIPIISTLLEFDQNYETVQEDEEKNDSEAVEENLDDQSDACVKRPTTLLEYISACDPRSKIEELSEHCSRGLEQFNETILMSLKGDIENAIFTTEKSGVKEIKGLEDRLYGLENLMVRAKKYVNEQSDLAQSFVQNQNRASHLRDASILPDLCESHRKQLVVMLQNHEQICDIHRRCAKAKEELSLNVFERLKFVIAVENLMNESNHKLMIYFHSLKRLRQHLEIIQQIHSAPVTYLSAVFEVVRRRTFSQAFSLWASDMACHMLTIHNEEVARRKDFQSSFDGHFLKALFPGMDDLPPNFATQAPPIFDSTLPKITSEDLEFLKEALPELAENLTVPDMTSAINFFLLKSIAKQDLDKVDDRDIEEKLVQVVNEVGLASNLDENLLKPVESDACLTAHGLAHLKDLDKGCESETDTEEFEKVCQSPLDLQFEKVLVSPRPGYQDASTLTEVGEKSLQPPKKPPRSFNLTPQRTLSISNTESFTNLKNSSLDSIDELSSLKNVDSCYNSHHQQLHQGFGGDLRSKSISPLSPNKGDQSLQQSPNSPSQCHQPSDFVNEEFYIDESLPSSLSIETGNAAHGDYDKRLSNANDVVALLQENLQSSNTEREKYRSIIAKIVLLSRQGFVQMRRELKEAKSVWENQKGALDVHISSLSSSWENLTMEIDCKEREIIRRLSLDHQYKIDELNNLLQRKDEEIKCIKEENEIIRGDVKNISEENESIRAEIDRLTENQRDEINELKNKLLINEEERRREVKEVSERLTREHKAEVDNMRKRFRLVTETEPNSERSDKSEASHESFLAQIKANFEEEKLKAINELKRGEQLRWQRVLEEQAAVLRSTLNAETFHLVEDTRQKVIEEKDKLIEALREKERKLNLECCKYRNTLQQLTEQEYEHNPNELLERLDLLEKEKCQLETELCMERSRRFELPDISASVAVCDEGSKIDTATSPIKQHKEQLTKSQTALIKSEKINIDSCNEGDTVLVMWDSFYENYMILQEGKRLFFLHSECVKKLNLKKPSSQDKKTIYFAAEVKATEYCHARKAENRYKVPLGTKFFRVKVEPKPTHKDRSQANFMTQSSSSGATQTESSAESTRQSLPSTSHSLPSTPSKDNLGSTVGGE